ncbi:hypothetical protein [Cellulomonas sp. Y8]|uniref:hypothetical protein n=1 Tax=Cellulomonas sp. Y8 TaxID=2591145 RepID=UPI003D74ED01
MSRRLDGVLASHLSAARMDTYRRCTASEAAAVELYRWNTIASGAVFETLALVEVVLRNAVDRELQTWNAAQPSSQGTTYTAEWLMTPARPLWGLLNRRARGGSLRTTYGSAFDRAKKDSDLREPGHARHGATITHDDVLAHVMFGTWPALLPDPKHANATTPDQRRTFNSQKVLWNQALCRAFPGQGSGMTVRVWVDRLHGLRNRVAHHEPLILTDLLAYHRVAARLVRAIDPDLGSWVAGISRVPEVVRSKPALI